MTRDVAVVGRVSRALEPGENPSIKLSRSSIETGLQVIARNCQATPFQFWKLIQNLITLLSK